VVNREEIIRMVREKVAKWMVERSYATGHGDTVEDLLKELEWQAVEREREGYRQGYADAMNWKTQNHLEHLPGREWVGLTVEEIKSLRSWWPSYEDAPALLELVKDVEAKLKEKNNGV
jgi:sulfur relay (sulfurtransferase) DsrC/TusE family protein